MSVCFSAMTLTNPSVSLLVLALRGERRAEVGGRRRQEREGREREVNDGEEEVSARPPTRSLRRHAGLP